MGINAKRLRQTVAVVKRVDFLESKGFAVCPDNTNFPNGATKNVHKYQWMQIIGILDASKKLPESYKRFRSLEDIYSTWKPFYEKCIAYLNEHHRGVIPTECGTLRRIREVFDVSTPGEQLEFQFTDSIKTITDQGHRNEKLSREEIRYYFLKNRGKS